MRGLPDTSLPSLSLHCRCSCAFFTNQMVGGSGAGVSAGVQVCETLRRCVVVRECSGSAVQQ